MSKLKLNAAPTFRAVVAIPVAGESAIPVEMTFKHRTKKALSEFANSRAEKTDAETFLDMVVDWDLEDEFTPAHADVLLENYIGAALATYRTYIDELVQAKLSLARCTRKTLARQKRQRGV
jgi:hypothetical protein